MSPKHILPACAAVLVAAAFALMCFFAPSVYAIDTTSTTVNDSLDDLAAHYELNNVDIQSAAFAVIQHGNFYITHYWLNPTITVNGVTTDVYGSRRTRTFNSSNGDVSYSSYAAHMSYTKNNNYITVQRTSSFGTDYNYYFSGSDTRACYGYGIPNDPLNSMVEAIPKILNDKLSSGLYGFGASLPVLGSAVPATDYYNNHIKSAVNAGTDPVTTTTTITTTTTTTTTTTGATLPPYPYETSPPFTLPADWIADYSETTPTPSLPPVGTADISGYDNQISDAESQLLPGIAFWFVLLGDFLLSVPGIIISAIVFCILIYLTITLLYHKGGD